MILKRGKQVAELVLRESEFREFSRYIHEVCGINIHEGKKGLLKARLAKILRTRDFSSYREYFDHVRNDRSGYELTLLLNSISTNMTYFFREAQHLEFLTTRAIPEIISFMRYSSRRPIRIWSAGCSSGEEPYSLAIAVMEETGQGNPEVEILATDISTRVLSVATKGIYEGSKVEKIPPRLRRKYFQRGVHQWEGYFRIKEEVRKKVQFERLNLMEEFQFREPFHIIFCRNVMIYFDIPTRQLLVQKFSLNTSEGGYLFVGLAESLSGIRHPYRYIQPSIYRKV